MSKVLNISKVQETILYKELSKKENSNNRAFIAAIPILCGEATDRIKILPSFFHEYTLHDESHFLRVTELMAHILGNQLSELNYIEISLLILSAYYHDQGMVITQVEFENLEKDRDFIVFRDNWHINHPNYKELKNRSESNSISADELSKVLKKLSQLESSMLTEYLRRTHGSRSREFVIDNYANDKRLNTEGANLATILGDICKSHTESIDWIKPTNNLRLDESIGTYQVNTIFICLILRLADILDFDSDRTPDILFKSIHFTNNISLTEWQKHRSVQGWEIASNRIRFSMYFEHPAYEKTARTFLDWIDTELTNTHAKVRSFPSNIKTYKLPLPEKVDRSRIGPKNNSYIYHDLEFTLSRDEIVKLLLTENLYKSPSILIRELLQNSLDAIRLRKASYQSENTTWNGGKVYFNHYVNDDDQEVLECVDDGSGMDELIITKFLGKVGRSYYKSPEFERTRIYLKSKGSDFSPSSQFGIGFMSCFMFGDRIEIATRKDYGPGKNKGRPLIIEINGLNGLILIKEGNSSQEIGTNIKIYSREKQPYFDPFSERLKLVKRLKGVALATEFPVFGKCFLEGLEEEVEIPSIIDKRKTFLEDLSLNKIKTWEVDLSEIHKDLKGYLRQSFLIDKNGSPTIKNDEAEWIQIPSKKFKDKDDIENVVLIKESGRQVLYNYFEKAKSVCLDGILVCGTPGRNEDSNLTMFLGELNSVIDSEHRFTIDVRGLLKPELSPAREPLDRGGLGNRPPGWKNLQRLINRGSSIIWEKIIVYQENHMSPEIFWSLLLIHEGRISHIKSQILIKYLKLPIKDSNNWISISAIDSFQDEKGNLLIESQGSQYQVEFSGSIKKLSRPHPNSTDFNWWIFNVLRLMSIGNFRNGRYSLNKTFNDNENPSDNAYFDSLSSVRFIKYDDDGNTNNVITSVNLNGTVNLSNDIVELAYHCKYKEHKNDLEIFSLSLCIVLNNLIKEQIEENNFKLEVSCRPLRYLSSLYDKVDWKNYDKKYHPPYKIYVNEKITLEVTKEILLKWGKNKS